MVVAKKNSKPIVAAMKKAKLEDWQLEDAKRLRETWDEKKTMSQTEFGATMGIGSQGMVNQYLQGLTPLNHRAVGKFAKGLGVLIDEISPTLADEIRELYTLCESRASSRHGATPEIRRLVEETVRRMMKEGKS